MFKKIMRILLIVIGVVVIALIGGYIYISSAGFPTYDVQQVDVTIEVTPERVAQGKRLSNLMCNHCHMNPATRTLAGRKMHDAPAEFGEIYSRNITKHPEYGIGKWSDGELLFFLRTGIHPHRDGEYVPPWMPKYPRVSDEDLYSLIAFLRSNEPEVTSTERENVPTEPSFLSKMLTRVGAFGPFEYPKSSVPHPDTTDMMVFGRYMANDLFECFSCHSADFKTNRYDDPTQSEGYYGGGNPLLDVNAKIVYSSNITPHETYGIGDWTDEELFVALKEGFRPDGSLIAYPMLRTKSLKDNEVRALMTFIKSVPALATQVPDNEAYPVPAGASAGEKLYIEKGCITCHGTTGIGLADLRKAYMKYPADTLMMDVIANPEKYYPHTIMPVWKNRLSEQELRDVAKYVHELGVSESEKAAMN
ncbi:MAG: cytochrome c [Ectothiorhodospiraceae bacterium]|nr:cytochrome c [Ectothiorhodospiraceae bacterium]